MSDIEQLREALATMALLYEPYPITPPLDVVHFAASELLALKENGQTVEVCERHGRIIRDDSTYYGKSECPARSSDPCRMVKGSLHIHREGTPKPRNRSEKCADEECVNGYLDEANTIVHQACHGRGTVYSPASLTLVAFSIGGIVHEAIRMEAITIGDTYRWAVAVLDALNDTETP